MLQTLINAIQRAGHRVMASSESRITVEKCQTVNGKCIYGRETIPANFVAVSAFLGD